MSDVAGIAGIPNWELHHRLRRALEFADINPRTDLDVMADYLGVSENTMRNYLKGHTRPRPGVLRAWALRCGVSYDWLSRGEVPAGPHGGGPGASEQGEPLTECYAKVA